MSAIANIVLPDGAGTPVNHTFYPLRSGEQSFWRENQSGLALVGQGIVSMSVKQGPLNKVRLVVDLPSLETATGANSAGYTAAPKVAYNDKMIIECFLPSRGVSDQRRNLRVFGRGLLDNPIIVDVIENLIMPY